MSEIKSLCSRACVSAAVMWAGSRNRETPGKWLVCSAPVPERNRGDQALLRVVVDALERSPTQVTGTVLATSNQAFEAIQANERIHIRTDFYPLFLTQRCFREAMRFPRLAMAHDDLLMIGADVLDEGYSVARSSASLRVLEIAQHLGLRTRILGFSVNGPPSEGLRDRLHRLGGKTRLFARDPESFRRLHDAGVQGVEQAGDLAFLLDPADFDKVPEKLMKFATTNRDKLVGLNLTEVVLREFGREEERLEVVAGACRVLAAKDGYRFVLLPHDEPEGVEYMRRFQHRLERNGAGISCLVDPLPHCRVLKRVAGLCRHVFTCRLHLGIATLGMGRPMTGFPYQGKFEGQFELFGMDRDGLIDADRFPTSIDEMVSLMRHRIAQSDSIAEKIEKRLPQVRELSRRNFDGLQLNGTGT